MHANASSAYHYRSMSLQHKVAYITGGTKGIGYGIAQSLLAQGMRVAISGRNKSTVESAAKSLSQEPGRVLGLVSDVRSMEDEARAVAQILHTWGALDVLIANAGLGHFAPIDKMTEEQWHETIDTNLTGVFHSVKASIPALRSSQGYIITIASLAGVNFFQNGAAYNASKFGLVGFSQAIMLDLRYDNIKVTTIMPGSVSSFFNDRTPSDEDAWKIQPEDIGQIVVDLLRMHPRTLPSKVEVRPTRPSRG